MKLVFRLLLLVFVIANSPIWAQSNLYGHKKERKRVWRHWRKNKQSYNPYLEKKARNKPSAKMARQEKKELKRQRRKFRRDTRRGGHATKRGPSPK
ncbi:MAG: hypothetical protein IT236_10240 [Bacteroidia bacterium]|nr:hypothetical protein [Bacteroidia bacterium]